MQNTPVTVWESLQTQGVAVAGAIVYIDPTTLQPNLDFAGMSYDPTTQITSLLKLDPGNIIGTTTNDNAAAGSVGEYSELIVLSGAAIALATGVAQNLGFLDLTPGDWDLDGAIHFIGNAATVFAGGLGSWGTVSATPVVTPGNYSAVVGFNLLPFTIFGEMQTVLPRKRITVPANQAGGLLRIYLVGRGTFTINSCSMYGMMRARRVR